LDLPASARPLASKQIFVGRYAIFNCGLLCFTKRNGLTHSRVNFRAILFDQGIGGTGLGLWVTQDLKGKHKGKISVRSSKRLELHGTVFRLFFPHFC